MRLSPSNRTSNTIRSILFTSRSMSSSPPSAATGPAATAPATSTSPAVSNMYKHESSLPHLPVPSLDITASRYLKSTLPFATPNTSSAVASFLRSPLVKTLQERLQKRATQHENWLSDWWNESAYFGWRGPNIPWVNYFYVHRDDKLRRTGPKRAAGLIRGLLYFRQMCDAEILEPEYSRKLPLCMASYKYLFNSTRLPVAPADVPFKVDDPAQHNYVVVVRKNKFYKVPICDPKTGEFLSERDLETMFEEVVRLAGDSLGEFRVGALTAADRDVWTEARKTMISGNSSTVFNEMNAASLQAIDSSIIIVSLDSSSPITREEVSWGCWVGDGVDRWFDKHQLIVFENGKSGFNGEHSSMDGTPTARLNDWLLRSLATSKISLGSPIASALSSLPPITSLEFHLAPSVTSAIATSVAAHDELMAKHDLAVLHYAGYGSSLIKTFKLSPDSFTQLIMVYAQWKLSGGKMAAVYESAQTRKYRRGRTEVIRSATIEAKEFCEGMQNGHISDLQKLLLLQKAGAAHIKLAGEAADGQGVDRHLFGLKKCLLPEEAVPELYTDDAFSKSSHWTLSTSQLTSEYFEGWGYGEVVSDGFGLAYSVNPTALRFTITSMNKSPEGVLQLRAYLEEACAEVREVMEKGLVAQAQATTGSAKL